MSSIRTIFYFISGFYLFLSILFAIFDRELYSQLGTDYLLLVIPYWLIFGCIIIMVGWSMQVYQEKNMQKRARNLEKENDKLKAKLYDLTQSPAYREPTQQTSKKLPPDAPKPSVEKPDKKHKPDSDQGYIG